MNPSDQGGDAWTDDQTLVSPDSKPSRKTAWQPREIETATRNAARRGPGGGQNSGISSVQLSEAVE